MNFLNLETKAFGLDISDTSIKIIKLKKRKKYFRLVSFGKKAIKKGLVEKGEIKNPDKLALEIRDLLKNIKGKKINTNEVVCSLPEENSFLQIISLPKMSVEEAKKAILYEAENYIPLSIGQMYVDSEIIPPLYNDLEHLDILLVALPKKTVDFYVDTLKKADLIPKALEPESLAIARAVIKNEFSPKPILIIDLGSSKTNFIIFSGKSVRSSTTISVSSDLFTQRIAKALSVSLEKAEKIKRKYGIKGISKVVLKVKEKRENNVIFFEKQEFPESEIIDTLYPPLFDLTEQIEKYLYFYLGHSTHEHLPPEEREKGISRILLSGGGANLKGLIEFLEEKLNLPIELSDPLVNILPPPLKNIPQFSFSEKLSYTTALGLALRGAIE